MLLARFVFQACSFNHSDISPFRLATLAQGWREWNLGVDITNRYSDSALRLSRCDALI